MYKGFHDLLLHQGTLTEEGSLIAAGMRRSLTLGASIEAPVHRSVPLALRLSVDRTLGSELQGQVFTGQTSCGTDCYRMTYRAERIGNGSVWLAAADLLARPAPADWRLQPYLLVGFGVKHFDFDRAFAADSLRFAAATHPAFHVGVGMRVALGGAAISLDGSLFRSGPRFLGDYQSPRNDAVLSLGVRFR